jgi:hypothetical protein
MSIRRMDLGSLRRILRTAVQVQLMAFLGGAVRW